MVKEDLGLPTGIVQIRAWYPYHKIAFISRSIRNLTLKLIWL